MRGGGVRPTAFTQWFSLLSAFFFVCIEREEDWSWVKNLARCWCSFDCWLSHQPQGSHFAELNLQRIFLWQREFVTLSLNIARNAVAPTYLADLWLWQANVATSNIIRSVFLANRPKVMRSGRRSKTGRLDKRGGRRPEERSLETGGENVVEKSALERLVSCWRHSTTLKLFVAVRYPLESKFQWVGCGQQRVVGYNDLNGVARSWGRRKVDAKRISELAQLPKVDTYMSSRCLNYWWRRCQNKWHRSAEHQSSGQRIDRLQWVGPRQAGLPWEAGAAMRACRVAVPPREMRESTKFDDLGSTARCTVLRP